MTTQQTITGAEIGLLSYLFEAVGDLLTDAQRQELTDQLTSLRPAGVAPGDLITAELFNAMLNNINDLLARVAVLEGAEGGPVIVRIDPEGIDKPTGSRITIIGSNFRPDDISTTVSFGNIVVSDFFPESNSTRIELPVPVGFVNLPQNVPVTVTIAGRQSNSVQIRVVAPTLTPSGTIMMRHRGDPVPEVVAGADLTLNWRLISQLNVARSFDLIPLISNVTGGANAQAWRDAIEFSVPTPVALEPGQTLDFSTTIAVPNNAGSADLTMRAESTLGSFNDNATLMTLTVGDEPDVSNNNASVSVRAFPLIPELRFSALTIDGSQVSAFKMQAQETIMLPMQLSTIAGGAGFYKFRASVEGQTARWIVSAVTAPLSVGANVTVPFDIPITSGASTDTTTVSFITIFADRFETAASPTPTFTSFERFPIVGRAG